MNVALVHDWLTGMRGGEKCLEVFCELFPAADLFTLVHVAGECLTRPSSAIVLSPRCSSACQAARGTIAGICR